MTLLYQLIIAHLLGDFVLQPDSWVADKSKNKVKAKTLYYHIVVHIVLMLILTQGFKYFWTIVLIGISHYIIDLTKLYVQTRENARLIFSIDQCLHILIIILFVENTNPILQNISSIITMDNILPLVLALLIITFVSSKIIKVWISKWTPETEDKDEESLSQAGAYIGILERLFVFSFVVTNNIEAVGFLLAAKSVFRFGDLKESKDRKLTEYILIGTLISFGIAILTALLYAYNQGIKIG